MAHAIAGNGMGFHLLTGTAKAERCHTPMNRARLVVTRSGYTTLMELAELGKPALLVPNVPPAARRRRMRRLTS